jgi:acyl carrier protein
MDTIKTQVKQYVMDNFLMGAGPEELRDEDSFMGQHVIDSVGVLELISYLEQTFGIKVEDEEMVPDNLDSLEGVGRYLQRKLGSAAA